MLTHGGVRAAFDLMTVLQGEGTPPSPGYNRLPCTACTASSRQPLRISIAPPPMHSHMRTAHEATFHAPPPAMPYYTCHYLPCTTSHHAPHRPSSWLRPTRPPQAAPTPPWRGWWCVEQRPGSTPGWGCLPPTPPLPPTCLPQLMCLPPQTRLTLSPHAPPPSQATNTCPPSRPPSQHSASWQGQGQGPHRSHRDVGGRLGAGRAPTCL